MKVIEAVKKFVEEEFAKPEACFKPKLDAIILLFEHGQ